MNRRIRNRTYGGVGGRRSKVCLLPDNNNGHGVQCLDWRTHAGLHMAVHNQPDQPPKLRFCPRLSRQFRIAADTLAVGAIIPLCRTNSGLAPPKTLADELVGEANHLAVQFVLSDLGTSFDTSRIRSNRMLSSTSSLLPPPIRDLSCSALQLPTSNLLWPRLTSAAPSPVSFRSR